MGSGGAGVSGNRLPHTALGDCVLRAAAEADIRELRRFADSRMQICLSPFDTFPTLVNTSLHD